MPNHRSPVRSLVAAIAAISVLSACDERFDPTRAGIRPPAISIAGMTGSLDVIAVNASPLPHITTFGGTNYSLVAGTFALKVDSSWEYSSTEVLSGSNGQVIGTSPANYNGKWTVTDSTVNILTASGFIRIKAETLFWKGGPRHNWEDSLTFTLLRK